MQVNVLLIAAVHHHGLTASLFHRRAAISAARSPSGAAADSVFCLTCQIVRQGAARPALVADPLRPDAETLVHLACFLARYPSVNSIVVFGRAPPVA